MLRSFVSLQELKVIGGRVALYTAVAYATIRAAGFAINQASRWVGIEQDRK